MANRTLFPKSGLGFTKCVTTGTRSALADSLWRVISGPIIAAQTTLRANQLPTGPHAQASTARPSLDQAHSGNRLIKNKHNTKWERGKDDS